MQNEPKYAVNLLVGAFFTAIVLIGQSFLGGYQNEFLRYSGVVILLLAFVFFFLPMMHLQKYGSLDKKGNYMQTTRVVQEGIYAIVRHPQYLGYMMLAVGFALLSVNIITIVPAILAVVMFDRQSKMEENFLLDQFGQEYAAYCAKTPRLNFIVGIFRRLLRR